MRGQRPHHKDKLYTKLAQTQKHNSTKCRESLNITRFHESREFSLFTIPTQNKKTNRLITLLESQKKKQTNKQAHYF